MEKNSTNEVKGESCNNRKRIINIRPLFVYFISVIVGIFFIYSLRNAIWVGKVNWGVVVSAIFFFLMFVCGIFSLAIKSDKLYKSKVLNFVKSFSNHKTAIIGGLIFFVIGAGLFSLQFLRYENYPAFDGDEVQVSARVVSDGKEVGTIGTTIAYELEDIVVTAGDEEYELKSGGYIYLYDGTELGIGDTVEFSAEISSADIKDGYYSFTNKTVYTFYNAENIEITGNKLYFDELVRQRVWNLLSDNMNAQNAGIAYSVLFGDKSEIDSDIQNSFSYSGIAHVLAVSGLHVGFLVAILSLLLKKLRANKYVNFGVIVSILIVYCYFCGFSPSVVRASLMATILLFALLFGFEYDSLSALSLAGLMILLVNPFDLLQVGFQLSFASVFGIITLAPGMSRTFSKWHFPKWLAGSLAITLAANIAVVLISLNYFNQFALLGVFTNLIVLPIFSIAYSILFILAIFGAIFSFMGVLLIVPDVLLHFIKIIANWVAEIPYAVVTVFKVGFISIVLLIVAMYISHFLMINKWLKRAISALLLTVVCVSLIVVNMPTKFTENEIYLTYQSRTNYALFVNENNERMLVGLGDQSNDYLQSFLTDLKVDKLDTLVVYEVSLRYVDYINQLVENYDIDSVLFASSDEEVNEILTGEILCKNVGFIEQNSPTEACGYSLYAYYYYGKATGVVVTDGETDTLLLKNKATWNALHNVSLWWDDTFENVIVNKSYVEDMDEVLYVDEIYSYGNSAIESDVKIDIGYKRNFTLAL